MMGVVLPETCWAFNKICNKYHLLHLVGILFPHNVNWKFWIMHMTLQPAKSLSRGGWTAQVVVTEYVSVGLPTTLKELMMSQSLHVHYLCLIHSCELYLPKTKSFVSGTANIISTACSLAAQSVLSLRPAMVSLNPAWTSFTTTSHIKP